jgi:hypothetical protein
MSTKSNLYAEKVFAEQPLALWTLDDRCDYVSLIPESSRNVFLWTVESGTVSAASVSGGYLPITESLERSATISGITRLRSPIILADSLDQSKSSVAVSIHAKQVSGNISSITLGIKTESDHQSHEFKKVSSGEWTYLSKTLPRPTGNFSVFLEISTSAPSQVSFNGLTVGQWSEEFSFSSLGVSPSPILQNPAVSGTHGIPMNPYGLSSNDAYVIKEENKLLARQSGLPLTYGTASSLALLPSESSGPSMIVPGVGFMNENGETSTYTLEFWSRIHAGSSKKRRIAGPISSLDGIYVDGPFIGIQSQGQESFHYVGEWYRPMLIQMIASEDYVSLLVNGEQVCNMVLKAAGYPDRLNSAQQTQDWIGFYCYPDIEKIEVECVAIYPYAVPPVVAKRRFAYGQAVDNADTIDSSYNGSSIYIDAKLAQHSNTYSYPDIGLWNQGVVENLSPTASVLSSPKHRLPVASFLNAQASSWESDLKEMSLSTGATISLKPNLGWSEIGGHLFFENLSFATDRLRAVYGVFQASLTQDNSKTYCLLRIVDRTNKDYFSVELDAGQVTYFFKYGSALPEEVFRIGADSQGVAETIRPGEVFSAGLDIASFSNSFGGSLSAFFGNPSRLSLYVGGTAEYTKTFGGFIHKVGFCSNRNFLEAAEFFSSNGTVPVIYDGGIQPVQPVPPPEGVPLIVDPDFIDPPLDGGFASSEYEGTIVDHVATYTLFGSGQTSAFDVATDSYWEDYIPLSRLAKRVVNSFGKTEASLGFVQFNIDYPRAEITVGQNIDTTKEIVKSYVSFQYISEGSNKSPLQFFSKSPAKMNGLVVPDLDWTTKKYEVLDGDVILPPQGIDIRQLSINVHIEMKSPSMQTKPVRIRAMSLVSRAFGSDAPGKIGTKFSKEIFPYTKYGNYNIYSSVVPFSTYKDSSPHLYLTNSSGIRIVGSGTNGSQGIFIPVNNENAPNFLVSSISFSMNSEREPFSEEEKKIAEIESNDNTVEIYVVKESSLSDRGRIFARRKPGLSDPSNTVYNLNGIVFFINGVPTATPYVSMGQWNRIGMAFDKTLNFSENSGGIRLVGKQLFGGISYYRQSDFNRRLEVASGVNSQMSEVFSLATAEVVPISHFYWGPSKGTGTSRFFGPNPSEIYGSYTGTDRLVVGDDEPLVFGNYFYAIYKDLAVQSITISPV